MKRNVRLCLLVLCLFGGVAEASETAWRLDRDKDGIQIYTRAVQGSDFRAIRGETRIRGRLSSVVALLQDMSFWPKLNRIISSARVHQQLSETESLVYLQMNMPWPVSDRDVLNRRQVRQDERTMVVELKEAATTSATLPTDSSYVRIVRSTQSWTLTPGGDGTVDVSWFTHTDPNGPIPAAVVNMLSVGAPFESLTTMRDAIEGGKYKDASLPYIDEP